MAICVGLSSFLIAFILWRHAVPSGILFYQGVACCMLATTITIVVSLKRSPRQVVGIGKDAALVLLSSYSFMFTVPTTVERSYTVKMLMELDRRSAMHRGEMLEWIEAHWQTSEGLSKRLHEQEASGSIQNTPDGLRLTKRGELLVSAFRITSRVFGTDGSVK